MSKSKKQRSLSKQNKHKIVPSVVRSEVNFLVLPYFTLDKHVDQRQSVSFSSYDIRNGQKVEFVWTVSPDVTYGMPTDFDRRVLRACEFFWSELPKPLVSPLVVPRARLLSRLMKVPYSGQFAKRAITALEKLKGVTIRSKFAAYDKQNRKWVNLDSFNLFDRIVTQLQDTNVYGALVYPSQLYLDNLNARYVCPLDYDYLMSLSPIASRLYELLSVKFYGAQGDQMQIGYKYSTLCRLLPTKFRRYKSHAIQQFKRAHNELQKTEFFSSVGWMQKKKSGSLECAGPDWFIRYVPGARYWDIQSVLKQQFGLKREMLLIEETPLDTPVIEITSDQSNETQGEDQGKEPAGKEIKDPPILIPEQTPAKEIKKLKQIPLFKSPNKEGSDTTDHERELLDLLKNTDGFPFDETKDLRFMRSLLADFPEVDFVEAVKSWQAWLLDNQDNLLKKNGKINYRTRLRNWVKKGLEFNGPAIKPTPQQTAKQESEIHEQILRDNLDRKYDSYKRSEIEKYKERLAPDAITVIEAQERAKIVAEFGERSRGINKLTELAVSKVLANRINLPDRETWIQREIARLKTGKGG